MDIIPFGFDPFFGEGFPSFFSKKAAGFPKVDVQETNTEVVVVADIPGFDPKKINVEIGEGSMRISGTTQEEKESKDKNFYRKERVSQSFERAIPLPCPVVPDGAKASAKNGTLTIRLLKKHPEPLKMKKIPVEEE